MERQARDANPYNFTLIYTNNDTGHITAPVWSTVTLYTLLNILQSPHKAQPGMTIFNTMSPGHQQLIQWPCSNKHYIPTILSYRLIIKIFEKILHALSFIIMVRSGHNFAHATTAELLWHVQNCVLVESLFFTWATCIFKKFGLWACELYVNWVYR